MILGIITIPRDYPNIVVIQKGSRHNVRRRIIDSFLFFKIHVYEIIIDLTGTSSHHTRQSDEKSGSTVLFILHLVGLDYQLVTFQIEVINR